MKPTERQDCIASNAPDKPVMIWDGDCGFCKFWIVRWERWTRGRVEYLRYQDPRRRERFPGIPDSDCEKAVQYVDCDGNRFRAAEAVFHSLTHSRWLFWLLWFYRHIPLVRPITENAYRFVAGNRTKFSWINRMLWGTNPAILRYKTTTNLFTRSVGFIFLIAFFSLWMQIHGLVGENGILPATEFMGAVDNYFDQKNVGSGRFLQFPTLGWFATGDTALSFFCIAGIICSTLALAGFFPTLSLIGAWLFYLSLARLGQDFLSFQWDSLLLEAGFLAVLISAWNRNRRAGSETRQLLGILLVRWLLFRLMMESGSVKLTSGDPTWRDFTALDFHFETQPLPTWIGWFAHQLPEIMLKSATIAMFVVELLVPLLIFAPRRLRLFSIFPLIGLQIGILLTGNYGFFNLLTIVLCFSLLDDRAVEWIRNLCRIPAFEREGAANRANTVSNSRSDEGTLPNLENKARSKLSLLRTAIVSVYALLAVMIGGFQLLASMGFRSTVPTPIAWVNQRIMPVSLINNYGLFAVMTTSRPELVIEGSADGVNWQQYIFKYKPGPLDERPRVIPFHMPRLDWQLWFAALNEGNPPRWIQRFCEELFEQSPDVIALLKSDPFEDAPPRYIRVMAYDYTFTDSSENSGNWWQAANKRYYMPLLQYQAPVNQ